MSQLVKRNFSPEIPAKVYGGKKIRLLDDEYAHLPQPLRRILKHHENMGPMTLYMQDMDFSGNIRSTAHTMPPDKYVDVPEWLRRGTVLRPKSGGTTRHAVLQVHGLVCVVEDVFDIENCYSPHGISTEKIVLYWEAVPNAHYEVPADVPVWPK